jgi:exodeoxyribonuclease VII large subunit
VAAAAQRLPQLRPDIAALQLRQRQLEQRMQAALQRRLELAQLQLRHLAVRLQQLNPDAVLQRGYSIVETADGSVISDATQLQPEQTLRLRLAKGRAGVKVTDVEPQAD